MSAPPLFARVLGAAFDGLAPSVRRLHSATDARRYRGEVQVRGDDAWPARLVRRAARLPGGYAGAIAVDVYPGPDGERWTRRFGAHAMPSHLFARGGALNERLGAARCVFALRVVDGGLDWHVAAVRVFGLPLPRAPFRGVTARAFEADGRYCFDVALRLPIVGEVVHYRGWLDDRAPQPLAESSDAF